MFIIDPSNPSMVWTIPVSCEDYGSEWMECSAEAEFSNKLKIGSKDFDNHFLASTMCGLICDFNGASNFIHDNPDPSQVSLSFNWTRKLWVERPKDLQHLVNPNAASIITEATHVVVSVLYGAQIFCVFAQDVNGKEEDEQFRKVTEEKLSKIVKRFQVAFENQLKLEKFKQVFSEEKYELVDLKCRLYVDLKPEPVYECSLFDAYECCIGLKQNIPNIGTVDMSKLKGVPIAIQLCPLQILLPSTNHGLKSLREIQDFDQHFVNLFSHILADLKRVVSRAEKCAVVNAEESCPALRDFVHLVSRYQHSLQENLKKTLVIARKGDDRLDSFQSFSNVKKAEYHPLFHTSQLEQWIDAKKAEKEMLDLIISKVGTTAVVLTDSSQLKEHVNKKNVLTVPSMDEWRNETLVAMKKYSDGIFAYCGTTNDDKPWHMIQSKKRLVFHYLKELVAQAKRNKLEPSQVNFIVTFGESGKQFGCSYSVYDNGNLLNSSFGSFGD